MRRLAVVLLSALFVGPAAHGQSVIADISDPLIAITAGFTGADVLLFGALEGTGKVVAVVEGPEQTIVMRKKDRMGPIWVNREEATFENVPAFYQIASTESLDEWLPLSVREAHQIGVEYLDLDPKEEMDPAEAAAFRNGLVRSKQRAGAFGEVEGRLTLIDGKLFRFRIRFPANVPTGMYTIRTMAVSNGRITDAQTTPLRISKAGFEAEVFRVAHQHGALYGIAAVVIAVIAGLGANALFQRR